MDGEALPETPELDPDRAGGPVSGDLCDRVVERLGLIASPKRIALLEALRDGEASVQELADRLDLRHQKASHHLGLLRQGGVVSRRTEGAASFYSISDWTLIWVIDQMTRVIDV
jgi:DNA-binding transcriptional ArsR family regulator